MMDLFAKLGEADMPVAIKDVCKAAQNAAGFYTELGILGNRIDQCNIMIGYLTDKSYTETSLKIQ